MFSVGMSVTFGISIDNVFNKFFFNIWRDKSQQSLTKKTVVLDNDLSCGVHN